MRYLVLALAVLSSPAVCADFDFFAGVAFSDKTAAQPEVDLPGPLGILRIEYETERETTVFCEHISSLSEEEKGSGLNHCGFLVRL